VAGHLLGAGAIVGAEANYRRAGLYADRAGEEADYLLARAFVALALWALEPQNDGRRRAYDLAREDLAALAEGQAYQEQLDGARKAFFSNLLGFGSQ
jgi:hypothetical protein